MIVDDQDTRVESDWEQALNKNNGDYAYAPDGGIIRRLDGGLYIIRNGNLQAACAGNWEKVERVGVPQEDIPDALRALGMSFDGWTYE